MVIDVTTLCQKVLKGIVLDVFYIIHNGGHVSRKEIHQQYKDSAGVRSPSSQSFRFKLDEALAILEAIQFVESRRDGTYVFYYLTTYGNFGARYLEERMEKDPEGLLRGSMVVARIALETQS